jgi:hypothetical protein
MKTWNCGTNKSSLGGFVQAMIHWEDHLRIKNANWQQIQLAINSTAHTSILLMSIDA